LAIVDDLLFIKRFRETKAETELQKSRAAVVLAQKAEDDAEATLREFVAFAERAEESWYRDLCSRLVKTREIAQVQQDVAGLRQTESEHENTLEARKSEHQSALDHMGVCIQSMRDASVARQKFVELARNFHFLAARELERKEELELEELASIRRDREDWEQVDA
jgi:type III secretion protein O